jgi:hypothetical protein
MWWSKTICPSSSWIRLAKWFMRSFLKLYEFWRESFLKDKNFFSDNGSDIRTYRSLTTLYLESTEDGDNIKRIWMTKCLKPSGYIRPVIICTNGETTLSRFRMQSKNWFQNVLDIVWSMNMWTYIPRWVLEFAFHGSLCPECKLFGKLNRSNRFRVSDLRDNYFPILYLKIR